MEHALIARFGSLCRCLLAGGLVASSAAGIVAILLAPYVVAPIPPPAAGRPSAISASSETADC